MNKINVFGVCIIVMFGVSITTFGDYEVVFTGDIDVDTPTGLTQGGGYSGGATFTVWANSSYPLSTAGGEGWQSAMLSSDEGQVWTSRIQLCDD